MKNSADCSILLKFYTEFGHMTPEVPLKFNSMSQRDATGEKFDKLRITQPRIVRFRFTTDYDHVTPDLPQTFKVNALKGKVVACHEILATKTRYIS